MQWILEKTELFEKKFDKLIPKNLQKKVKKQIQKLTENPFKSKPLGFRFFREKKIDKWRIYFLIYEEVIVVYFIDLSDKKLQQKIINEIKEQLQGFKEYIEKKFT